MTGTGQYVPEINIGQVGGAPVTLGALPVATSGLGSAQVMTPGTTYAPGRAIAIVAKSNGWVELVLADGSSITVLSNGSWQLYPLAVQAVNPTGTTAVAIYYNLS